MLEKTKIPQIKPENGNTPNIPAFQQIKPDSNAETKKVVDANKTPGTMQNQVMNTGNKAGVIDRSKIRARLGRKKKPVLIAGLVLLVFILITALLSFNTYRKARALEKELKAMKAIASSQDFTLIKPQLEKVDKSLSSLQGSYRLLSYLRIVPFVGGYVSDGQHALKAAEYGVDMGYIVLDTAEPYADLLGFDGNGVPETGEKTTADRIDFLVKTIPDILPKLDEIEAKMLFIQKETDKINANRYPVTFAGKPVRATLKQGLDSVDELANLVSNGKPLFENATYLLGIDDPRTYLVLFQNDKELRPSGGFITAYSIMKVDKAKFEPVASDDIYHLDAKYKPSVPAPDPIIDYLKGPYVLTDNLYLRDMNWSPDFKESMSVFVEEIETVGIEDIDGVIAVDTGVLVNLLDVLGPIGVAGFGNFSTEIIPECNCPQVIYELESFADVEGPIVWDPAGTGKIIYSPPNTDNRKKIIGPLMNSIFSNALGQPKQKLGELFQAGYKSLMEKHVLLYMLNEEPQVAAEAFGVAGKIKDFEGDYLHINDANLGGRKSNLYVTQEVQQEIDIARDGTVEKTVTITYNNPEKHDGWLNEVLPNWVRIYVPEGSELITFEGVEDQDEPYEDLGKTVYAGFFKVRPQGVAKVIVKYKLPFKVKDEYNMFVQKQPGKDAPLYINSIGKQEDEHLLLTDKVFKYRI
ncbi:DUF4012 domain-containing protein [Patescibacteria group bacterium]